MPFLAICDHPSEQGYLSHRPRTRRLVAVMRGDVDLNQNANLKKIHDKQRGKRPSLSDRRDTANRRCKEA
jgi:hypothetical protein